MSGSQKFFDKCSILGVSTQLLKNVLAHAARNSPKASYSWLRSCGGRPRAGEVRGTSDCR
jgi:hypothetical protein